MDAETSARLGEAAGLPIPAPDAPPSGKSKSKGAEPTENTIIGFQF